MEKVSNRISIGKEEKVNLHLIKAENSTGEEQGEKFLQTLFAQCTEGYIEFRPIPVGNDRQWIPVDDLRVPQLPGGKDVYVGVATRHNKKGTKDDIIEIPAVWIDVDFKKTPEEDVLKRLDGFTPKPSIRVKSGHGFHLYWVLEKPAEFKAIRQIEDLNRRLADFFDGDKGSSDAAHILRLPGTTNLKYDPPRPVILCFAQTNEFYNLCDFDFLPPHKERPASKGLLNGNEDFIKGVPEGERHTKAAQLVGRYSGKKLTLKEVFHIMNYWNQNNLQPLPTEELSSIINDIYNKNLGNLMPSASNTMGKADNNEDIPTKIAISPELTDLVVGESLAEAIEKAELGDIPDLLKRIANEPQTETERAIYIEKLSKKADISKRAIQADIKRLMPNLPTEDEECSKVALFKGLVDIVIDENDDPAYLVKEEELLVMKTTHYDAEKSLVVPPNKESLPFELARGTEVLDWYANDDHQKLFDDIIAYLKRFSYTTDDKFLILACFVFATYLQDNNGIDYLPTIYLFAAPEHGKTRVGKSMSHICYRGIHCVDLRETNIFRFSDRLQPMLFFDIMDLWSQIEKSNSRDVFLLRNERGAIVPRVLNPEKGPFDDMTMFKIFGASIVASNKDVHNILQTRCIPIDMPNKPGFYENPSPDKATDIKARLIAWRAHYMDKSLPDIETVQALIGRLWDISKPLLQICKMVCPQRYDELITTLTNIAESKKVEKSDSFEAKIISIVHEMFVEAKVAGFSAPIIGTERILQRVNDGLKDGFKMSSQGFGRKLNSIGIKTTLIGGHSKVVFDEKALGELMQQYGLETDPKEKTLTDKVDSGT